MPAFRNNFEEDAPVTHPAAKTGKALQFAEVTLKGILLHFRQSSQNARFVGDWNPLK
jgi:hypothetical protein